MWSFLLGSILMEAIVVSSDTNTVSLDTSFRN